MIQYARHLVALALTQRRGGGTDSEGVKSTYFH